VIVPIGCSDPLYFIKEQAAELSATFFNGNRKDLLEALDEMPLHVAYAVLATIMGRPDNYEERKSLKRFLQEIA
jgi:hypothetical protein